MRSLMKKKKKPLEEIFINQMSTAYKNISGLLIQNSTEMPIKGAFNAILTLTSLKSGIAEWFEKITFNDGIVKPPKLSGLFLGCYREELSPFNFLYTKPKIAYHRRNSILLVLSIITAFIMVKNGYHTYQLFNKVNEEIIEYDKSLIVSSKNKRKAIERINKSIELVGIVEKNLKQSMATKFFDNNITKYKVRKNISNIVLHHILQPSLKDTTSAEKALFYIFLIESCRSTNLRLYMLDNIVKISAELGLSVNALRLFLNYNNQPLDNFEGVNAYPASSSNYLGEQYRYLINMYNNLTTSRTVTIEEVNNFLKYYFEYYNKKVTLDILLNKHFPKIKSRLSNKVRVFVEKFQEYLNDNTIQTEAPAEIIDNIKSFIKVRYTIPKDLNFIKLVGTLNNITKDAFFVTGEKSFLPAKNLGEIKKRTWEQTIAIAKINSLIRNYFFSHKVSEPLFPESFKSKFLPISINSENLGSFIYQGSYEVSGFYTKLALQSAVIPFAKQYRQLITKLRRLNIEVNELEYAFNYNIRQYVKNYAENYIQLIQSLNFKVESEVQLKIFLYSYSSLQSPLINLINTIKANTDFEIGEENKFMEPVAEKFKVLNNLIKPPKAGEVVDSGINLYLSILDSAYGTVKSDKKEKTPAEYKKIKSELTQTGRLALDIAINKKDSYLNVVYKWLDNLKIPEEMRGPFVKPVLVIYNIGSREIRQKLSDIYINEYVEMIEFLKQDFPFNPESPEVITVQQMNEYLGPKGKISTLFNNYFKPFLVEEQGIWVNKNALLPVPLISEEMLQKFTKVVSLQKTLWEDSGKYKKIEFYITPMLINEPSGNQDEDEDDIIRLTYFTTGTETVAGINTLPISIKTEVYWWENTSSQVGAELTTGQNFGTSQIVGAYSFFRMFKIAKYVEATDAYYWQVKITRTKSIIVDIGFRVKPNPMYIFKL